MKIAIDVSQIVYEGLGVATYTKYLTKNLIENDTENSYIFYAGVLRSFPKIFSYKRKEPWKKATWKIWPFPPKFADKLFNTADHSIDQYIGTVDIFHASDWTHPKTNVPSITTVHDLIFSKYPETFDPSIVNTQKRRMQRAKDLASHFIVDSKSTKNDLMKEYKIEEDRISTIYPAHSEEFFPQKTNDINQVKNKYNIRSDYILSLGTKNPRKNLQKVIEAFKAYKEQEKNDTILVIAGRHGWGKKLKTERSDIIETGYIEQSDLPSLYSGASAFLYPSLYEGFGFPVLEAMACAAPVITSNISSLPEVAGSAGILIDPSNVYEIRDALIKAIKRKDSISKDSLKQAAKFSWKKTAEETLKIYENVYTANRK